MRLNQLTARIANILRKIIVTLCKLKWYCMLLYCFVLHDIAWYMGAQFRVQTGHLSHGHACPDPVWVCIVLGLLILCPVLVYGSTTTQLEP